MNDWGVRIPIETIPQKTMDRLFHYHWPGNVLELENPIEQTVLLSQGPELIVDLGLPKHNLPKALPPILYSEITEREHIITGTAGMQMGYWRSRRCGHACGDEKNNVKFKSEKAEHFSPHVNFVTAEVPIYSHRVFVTPLQHSHPNRLMIL